MTVELIKAPVVLDLPSKPDVRNQFGNSDNPGKSNSTGKKLEDILASHFDAIGGLTRLSEIRTVRRSGNAQLTQLNGQPANLPGTVEVAVDQTVPADINDSRDLIGRTQLLMNMIPLILQTDSSRVISVMIQDHLVVPKVEEVSREHHNLSHHGFDPEKIEQLKKIEIGLVKCFNSLLTQLKGKKEADGSLLDNTTVIFGSNLGNANSHDTQNLPIILAGGGFQHGKYIAYDRDNNTPLCNLFVTMLNKMKIETESFAQSSGTLTWS